VAVAETRRPSAWEDEPLFDVERLALSERVVEARLREFRLGRACARRALGQLGWPAAPIPRGPNREPLWPAGIWGSITHCQAYGAAAVAEQRAAASLGIDAELNQALDSEIARLVCTPAEQDWLLRAPEHGLAWSTLIFSAKESLYKAWYPLRARWLDFLDADLRVDPHTGTFTTTLDGLRAHGRFAADATLLYTAVMLSPNA
jgi:4'-phosphopantetheinyl transferase EntD